MSPQFHCCLAFLPLPSDSDRKLLLLHQGHLTWHPRPTMSSLIFWLLLISTNFTWFLLFKGDVALFWCFQLLIVFNDVPFSVFVNAYPKWSDSLFCNYNLKSSFPAVFKVVLIPSAFLCNFFFFCNTHRGYGVIQADSKGKVNFLPNVKTRVCSWTPTWQKEGTSSCSQISTCVLRCMFAHECTHVYPLPRTKNVIELRRLSYETQTQSWWSKKGRREMSAACDSPSLSEQAPEEHCTQYPSSLSHLLVGRAHDANAGSPPPCWSRAHADYWLAHWDKYCISVIPAILWGTSSQAMSPKDCSPSSSEPVRCHHLSMLM